MQFIVKTKRGQEIVDITDEVKKVVEKNKVKDGICCVYSSHATCSIIINENYDLSVCDDILTALNSLIPLHSNYKHDKIDNNAHAHVKSAIIGPSQTIPIENGKLALGRWQGIALAEFDGPRERTVIVNVVGK